MKLYIAWTIIGLVGIAVTWFTVYATYVLISKISEDEDFRSEVAITATIIAIIITILWAVMTVLPTHI